MDKKLVGLKRRSFLLEFLEQYNMFLMKQGYTDSDIWCENPTALDQFCETREFKESLQIFKNLTDK